MTHKATSLSTNPTNDIKQLPSVLHPSASYTHKQLSHQTNLLIEITKLLTTLNNNTLTLTKYIKLFVQYNSIN